ANSTCNGRGTCDFESGCCLCDEGYVGMRCEHSCHVATDCNGHGKCNLFGQCEWSCYQNTTTGLGSCMCTDTDRWTGRVCNEARCPGSSISGSFLQYCSGRGLCNKALHQCYCEPGWLGGDCSVIDCPGDPDCSSHGSCGLSQDAQPVCTCSESYFGSACQYHCANGNQCNVVCSGYGVCNSGTCDCNPLSGWRGESCEVPGCPGYNGLDCTGHGECISSTHTCVCDAGWRGVACHEPDYCQSGWMGEACNDPCVNGVQCDSAEADCTCEPGWRGIGCEYPDCPGNWMGIDCGSPCLHGKQVTCCSCGNCVCDRGWAGTGCNSECSGHGEIVDGICHCDYARTCNSATSVCTCEPGWVGYGCEHTDCPGEPDCMGRGVCDGHGLCSGTSCACNAGYWGEKCEVKGCPGDSQSCSGVDGSCSGNGMCSVTSSSCECFPGWTGVDCATPDCGAGYYGIACEYQCRNGSINEAAQNCSCAPCYSGHACDVLCSNIGSCSPEGTCICGFSGGRGQYCEEPGCPGWFGDACEKPCVHGNPSDGECVCDSCHTGIACDIECSGYGNCSNSKYCSGHGHCNVLEQTCHCYNGWKSAGCEVPDSVGSVVRATSHACTAARIH
uniref:EGF-like domain-containing protein n=1 Tax=Ciona savignyi TaxID=51511 RepID=H2Z5F0_CIOSA